MQDFYMQTRETRVFKETMHQVGFKHIRVDASFRADHADNIEIAVRFMKQTSHWTQWLMIFLIMTLNYHSLFITFFGRSSNRLKCVLQT